MVPGGFAISIEPIYVAYIAGVAAYCIDILDI